MKTKAPLLLLMSGVFFIADRLLKANALRDLSKSFSEKMFGWEPFLNKGIAFGIILPPYLIFIFTVGIIFSVVYLFYLHTKETGAQKYKEWSLVGLSLVITGAVSNLVDRLAYGITIDYFRIYTSVINLADVLIISGFVLYFASLKHLK